MKKRHITILSILFACVMAMNGQSENPEKLFEDNPDVANYKAFIEGIRKSLQE